MNRTSGEIIARALCTLAELDPDELIDGVPTWFELRAQAMTIENALQNEQYVIVHDEPSPNREGMA